MSFQIKSIGLYNNDMDLHIIDFNLDAVNVIVGDSNTGKSSVLAIINYCLCGNNSKGIKDKIYEKLSYYGIHLVNSYSKEERIIIRKAPESLEGTSEKYFIIEDPNTMVFPKIFEGINQCDDKSTRIKLALFAGIEKDFYHEDESQITIRHPLSLNFLTYEVLADDEINFYRQNDFFHFRSFKDFFPYFLGIENVEISKKHQVVRELQQSIKNLKQSQNTTENYIDKIINSDEFNKFKEDFSITSVDQLLELDLSDKEHSISEGIQKIENDLSQVNNEIKQLKKSKKNYEDFNNTINLPSKDIVESNNVPKISSCPLCSQHITQSLDIESLQKDLGNVYVHKTHSEQKIKDIQNRIEEKLKAKQELEEKLQNVPTMIDSRSELIKQAVFLGQIKQYFKNKPISSNHDEIREKEQKRKGLLIEIEGNKERKENEVINIISEKITTNLQLIVEGTGNIYFDLNRLIPVDRTQGGKSNHISRKISMYLALHEYLINNKRPVPNFLVIDQFSQSNSGNSIADTETNTKILSLLYKSIGLQIILLEHIDYEDEGFQNKVIAKWRDGENGLLPKEWIEENPQ